MSKKKSKQFTTTLAPLVAAGLQVLAQRRGGAKSAANAVIGSAVERDLEALRQGIWGKACAKDASLASMGATLDERVETLVELFLTELGGAP